MILPSYDTERLLRQVKLNQEYLDAIDMDPLKVRVKKEKPELVRDYSFDTKREMPDER